MSHSTLPAGPKKARPEAVAPLEVMMAWAKQTSTAADRAIAVLVPKIAAAKAARATKAAEGKAANDRARKTGKVRDKSAAGQVRTVAIFRPKVNRDFRVTYQWRHNGRDIFGASGPRLSIESTKKGR